MATLPPIKPSIAARNKPADQDWHREEIKCAIRLKGYSIASLSRAYGLAGGTLANALTRPWPKGESIIALTIGIKPELIWPTRYESRRLAKVKRAKRHEGEV